MLDLYFILIVLVFVALIVRASLIKIVPTVKPKEKQNIRMENAMKDADGMDYPISDEEFEEVRKAYGNTEGSGIGIAITCLMCIALIGFAAWELFGVIHKVIYILIAVISGVVWWRNYSNNRSVFEKDRAYFRKKKAYLLDDDVKTFYAPRYAAGHFRGVNEVNTFKVMVGIIDADGTPKAYVLSVDAALHNCLKVTGACDAILYKGKISGLADLERCPRVAFEKGAKNMLRTGFGVSEDKEEKN